MTGQVSLTPNQRIIVAGADHIRDHPGFIKFWTFDTGELIRADKWLHYEMRSLLTTPDSRSIIVSGRDDHTFKDGTHYIMIGDITTGEYQQVRAGHDFSIDLSFTRDKKYVLLGEHIWDWRIGGNLLPKRDSDPLIKTVGKIVLTEKHTLESTDEGFVIENFQTGEIVQKFSAVHDNDTHRFAPMKVTPDGHYILSQKGNYWSKNATLAMWDLKTGSFVKTFDNCKAPIRSIDITADGQYVIAFIYDENEKSVIKVLDTETGKLKLSINAEE